MQKHSYWLWESVLSEEFCNLVLKETDWSEKEKGAVLYPDGNSIVDKETRVTNITWVSPMSPIGCVALSYIYSANEQAGWNYDINNVSKIQISQYEKSGHYDWHIDTCAPDINNIQRKLSLSIQLNDSSEFTGGKLEFKNLSEEEQPKLQRGSVIVFPSYLQHRVTEVTSGTRYSAVTWAYGPAFK